MKWGRTWIFSLFTPRCSRYLTINSLGTKCTSTVDNKDSLRQYILQYFNVAAIQTIHLCIHQRGCFAFKPMLTKLLRSKGNICSSWVTKWGNGWKYPKSWYIISFLAEINVDSQITNQPWYLLTEWNRIISGFRFIQLTINHTAEIILNPVNGKRKDLNFLSSFADRLKPQKCTWKSSRVTSFATLDIYISMPPLKTVI